MTDTSTQDSGASTGHAPERALDATLPESTSLDASQRESFVEGGETDTRSQDLSAEYEDDGPRRAQRDPGLRGQPVSGGQYGSASDANEIGTDPSETTSPSPSSSGD